MAIGSPSTSVTATLVYGSGANPDALSDGISGGSGVQVSSDAEADDTTHDGRSMYVTLFEDMLMEVLRYEGRLFIKEELDCFMAWHRLPYNAKYLFCRLCLRKLDKWHRLDALNYEKELGHEGILDAVQKLCTSAEELQMEDVKPKVEDCESLLKLPVDFFLNDDDDVKPKVEPTEPTLPAPIEDCKQHAEGSKQQGPETIDLTMDEECEQPQAGPSRLSPAYEPLTPPSSSAPSSTQGVPDYSVFADDEEQASPFELLDCLRIEELEELAKQLKLKPRFRKRDAFIEALLRGSANQTTLPFVKVSQKGKEPAVQTNLASETKKSQKSLMQSRLSFKPTPKCQETQQERLREIVIKKLNKCIRLNAHVVALFRRVNLVYFRSTQYTPDILTPAILTRAKKRAYAAYTYTRTTDIWLTREDLLAYEEALAIEAEVDALLESPSAANSTGRGRSTASRTPALMGGPSRVQTPVTPVKGKASPVASKVVVKTEPEEKERVKSARAVKDILDDVFSKWVNLVETQREKELPRKGLERFECGHILTRVVCKGAYALGVLKEYYQELKVLQALLAQTRWRRGRRGRWYERRALVLMTHLKHEEGRQEEAMWVVIDALKDPDTHIVFRPMLERRLTRLEKSLNIPLEERHVCEGSLQAPVKVFVDGVRIYHRAGSLLLDQAGRVVNQSPVKTQGLSWANRRDPSPVKVKQEGKSEKAGGKSVWKGRNGDEVSVEELALQWYQDQHGCKGFHCEGRIVTTLFGLLFWDVIFAPIPGAFETRYQSAPLDLAEDTFYYSREELVEARLAEIEKGGVVEIIERTYDAHQDVMCVGVRWDLFTKDDLLGIARCLHANVLVAICRLMCEDYAGRTGGVPDLIVWKEDEGYAKFVEVKGPNDSLQENQKVWINVLLQAGMPVELCHVHESGQTPKVKHAGKTPKKEKAASAGRKRKRGDELPVESEEDELDYSQLDRHTEDEEAVGASTRKKRKTHAAAVEEPPQPPPPPRTPPPEPEPLTIGKRKMARVNSQVQVVITTTPPRCSSGSPRKRMRAAGA